MCLTFFAKEHAVNAKQRRAHGRLTWRPRAVHEIYIASLDIGNYNYFLPFAYGGRSLILQAFADVSQ